MSAVKIRGLDAHELRASIVDRREQYKFCEWVDRKCAEILNDKEKIPKQKALQIVEKKYNKEARSKNLALEIEKMIKRGWSYDRIAKKLKIERQTVLKYEKNRRKSS